MTGGLALSPLGSLPELRMAPSLGSQSPQPVQSSKDFGAMLEDLAANTINAVRHGEAAAIAGVHGSLPLQTVVESVMAAERTLQTSIAVRDKFISSYLEITRMQI